MYNVYVFFRISFVYIFSLPQKYSNCNNDTQNIDTSNSYNKWLVFISKKYINNTNLKCNSTVNLV